MKMPEAAIVFGMITHIVISMGFRRFFEEAKAAHWHSEHKREDYSGRTVLVGLSFLLLICVYIYYRSEFDPLHFFTLGLALAAVLMPPPSEPEVYTNE